MNSLVLELQSEALDPSSSVLDLLRKASLIAYRLDVRELREWVNFELKGYEKYSQVPKYRFVDGNLLAYNPVRGWIPVALYDVESADTLLKRPANQPISQLIDIADLPKTGQVLLQFPKKLELHLIQQVGLVSSVQLSITTSQIKVILEAVKDIILNWSLRLERDGILGEGMTFSTREREVASHANYHVENLYNYSSVENAMSKTKIEQNNSSIGVGVNQGKVKTEKLAGTINEAQSQNLAEAAAEIQALLEQLSETYPTTTSREKNIVIGEAVDRIENNPTLKARVINALKTGGTETFKEAIDHPLVNILMATIEGWQQG